MQQNARADPRSQKSLFVILARHGMFSLLEHQGSLSVTLLSFIFSIAGCFFYEDENRYEFLYVYSNF